MDCDDLLEAGARNGRRVTSGECGGCGEGRKIDKPRLRIHGPVCACLLLSLVLCTLRARNGRPICGSGAIEYTVEEVVGPMNVPTYPSAPDLHDDFSRVEVIALDDLLYAGGRIVEPEVMLRVGEHANVGFEPRGSGRHGRGGGQVVSGT